jgi:diadenosine tetraphosphate (Ap4A) HIT family hydrolase
MAYPFFGILTPYERPKRPTGSEEGLKWGQNFLVNLNRVNRPRVNLPDGCPLCLRAQTLPRLASVHPFTYRHQTFVGMRNEFPIVREHGLIYPAEHRLQPQDVDFWLALDLVTTLSLPWKGSISLDPDAAADQGKVPGNAVYLNTRGAGQTIEHLHLHVMPAPHFLLPRVSPAEPVIGLGPLCTILTRCLGLPFYALAIMSPDVRGAVDALVRLHSLLQGWGVPYNLLAYPAWDPAPAVAATVTLLLVPRDREYCPAGLTSVAGFELLTGVLVPDVIPDQPLTLAQRDEAFQEATLDPVRIAQLESRLLGSRLGSPHETR